MSHVTCHMSHITCHIFTCHMSHVTCHMSHIHMSHVTCHELHVTGALTILHQDPVIEIYAEDLEDAIQAAEVAVVGEFTSAAGVEMLEKIAWTMGPGSTFYQIEDSQVSYHVFCNKL